MALWETTARPNRMVSNDPIKDYMQRHACGFPEALEALAAQLGPTPRPRHQTRPADAGPGRGAGGSTRGAGSVECQPDAANVLRLRVPGLLKLLDPALEIR